MKISFSCPSIVCEFHLKLSTCTIEALTSVPLCFFEPYHWSWEKENEKVGGKKP